MSEPTQAELGWGTRAAGSFRMTWDYKFFICGDLADEVIFYPEMMPKSSVMQCLLMYVVAAARDFSFGEAS